MNAVLLFLRSDSLSFGDFFIRGGRKKASIGYLRQGIQLSMGKKLIFDEKYRVVGIERDRLLVRGVRSGDVLTIMNPEPSPLTAEDFPLGKLIALTDPSMSAMD